MDSKAFQDEAYLGRMPWSKESGDRSPQNKSFGLRDTMLPEEADQFRHSESVKNSRKDHSTPAAGPSTIKIKRWDDTLLSTDPRISNASKYEPDIVLGAEVVHPQSMSSVGISKKIDAALERLSQVLCKRRGGIKSDSFRSYSVDLRSRN
jgi:hypothetical protein